MKKTIYIEFVFFTLILILFSSFLQAQDLPRLEKINKEGLTKIIDSSQADVYLVIIYTNECRGTKYVLDEVKSYIDKYGGRIKLILCNSSFEKEMSDIPVLLKSHSINLPVTYMIDKTFYPEKRMDDRKKGYFFRNDICPECRKDIIGVPYRLMYDKNKKLIYHGYRSPDFDRLLIENLDTTIKS
jgi:hypothetical protein